MICDGLSGDHCCHLGTAGVCTFLEEGTVPGRRWACGLRRELGDWQAVHADARYLADVRPKLDAIGVTNCGDWPPPGMTCATCGVSD